MLTPSKESLVAIIQWNEYFRELEIIIHHLDIIKKREFSQ